MIQCLNELPDQSALECDICIVGSGAAGLAIATELIPTRLNVLILESGAAANEPAVQALYECVNHEHPFPGAMNGRFRIYGGSTTQWGGQALRLTRLDFAARSWVAHSGWPIQLDDLIPYYQRASAFMRIDQENFDTDLFPRLRLTPPAFDPALVHYHFSKWSPQPNFRAVYGKAIAASTSARLLTHANLTEIRLTDTLGHVSEIRVRSLEGKSATVRPRVLVLCTGGIETARILLASNKQQKNGIGNDRDLVGRFFQDHPHSPVAAIDTDHPDQLQKVFNTFYRNGLKYTPRFSLSHEAQRENQILNVSACLLFNSGVDSTYQHMRDAMANFRRGRFSMKAVKHILQGVLHLPTVSRPVYEYLVRGRAYAPDPAIQVGFLTEQEPNPESHAFSRIGLDALGMPRTEIRWRITDLTLKTVRVYCEILGKEFVRLGLGRLKLLEWLLKPSDWREILGDSNHHMGSVHIWVITRPPAWLISAAACMVSIISASPAVRCSQRVGTPIPR